MSKSKEIIDAELDATQLLGRWSNFRFFGNRQAARYRLELANVVPKAGL
jgi:hypothetical protein